MIRTAAQASTSAITALALRRTGDWVGRAARTPAVATESSATATVRRTLRCRRREGVREAAMAEA
jgi:hypothetical protein